MSDFLNKRTIEFVLNKEDGSTVYADDFFVKPENEVFKYRNELQKAIKGIRKPFFVCYFCGQNIKINGGGLTKKILHFAHKKDSNDCHLKTDNNYSRLEIQRVKYNGAKESHLHFETKKLIKEFIESNNEFSNIKVEKVLKSNTNYLEWKKPDISASYKNINIVFEIQLSTTFLSVIVDREYFYKENKTYILWVFRNFVIDEFKQRFTEKDVFYSNNRNAFVLDNQAINLSQQNNDLYLLCYYQIPIIENLKINYNWECKYVCFEQLTFDEVNFKVFYFDVEKEERILKEQILTIEKELREKKIAKQEKEEALNSQNVVTPYYNYYYNEIEEEKPIIDRKEQYIIERNKLFDEVNRSTQIKLRNVSYITNYQRLFLTEHNLIYDKIFELFRNGYIFTKTDLSFINKEFENKILTTEKLNEFTIIYFISISIFLSKLSKHKELFNSYNSSIQQLLFTILSIKKKRVIGSNFSNLIQVVNHYTNLKNDRVVFFDVVVKAIEIYWGIDKFCSSEDKKGLLKPKILNTNNWKPQQDTKYNKIVSIVFPEMKF
ncbi:DUF6035 family protein [uncultured Flavobacterium sp.]|uniref:DUF6035 family protein n=1 Tax=uncultured Flavobacterium sp. TaxID=165435 RepID=UPI00260A5A78|nr:DUF6035 family protein [uncultured Flavobacterium sp.]